MSANNDTISKTILVAVLLCLVCSVIVAGAAVSLKPKQVENKLLDKRKNVLAAAGLLEEGKSVQELFKQVQTRIVNLETGDYASEADIAELEKAGYQVSNFDQKKLAKDSAYSVKLTKAEDLAQIKRLEKFAAVFIVEKDGAIDRIILPVHGYGICSNMYGFVALEGDAETVAGLGFYAHGETPGLGGEVDNPAWKALWTGKKLHNADGAIAIDVIKGKVDAASASAINQVDGLSGATLTSRGVGNLMQFWVGPKAFAAYLKKMKEQGV